MGNTSPLWPFPKPFSTILDRSLAKGMGFQEPKTENWRTWTIILETSHYPALQEVPLILKGHCIHLCLEKEDRCFLKSGLNARKPNSHARARDANRWNLNAWNWAIALRDIIVHDVHSEASSSAATINYTTLNRALVPRLSSPLRKKDPETHVELHKR